jgi:isoleucyl-tRNA synthetase
MDNNVFTILDTTLTPELINQGYVREVISKIQQLRKQADFEMMDEIKIYMCADDEIGAAVEAAKDFIMDETIAVAIEAKEDLPEFDINGHKTGIAVERIG